MTNYSRKKRNPSIVDRLKKILNEIKSKQEMEKKKTVFTDFVKSELELFQKEDIHIGI